MVIPLTDTVNTLPSGHIETHDWYPMYCWRFTHFYVFLHDVLHIHLSSDLLHFSLQGYWQLNAGCLGLKLQINRSVITPSFLEIQACNKGTTHSDTPSVFLQLQSLLCIWMFCKHTIFLRELYAETRSDVSDNSDNESLDRDCDISPTSLCKQFWSSVIVVTSESETSTIEEESNEQENSDVWCKTSKMKQWAFPWNHRSEYSNW